MKVKGRLRLLGIVLLCVMAQSAMAEPDLLSGSTDPVQVNTTNPNTIVVYIQEQEYEHPIKLWQYYKDYWFTQGPYLQAAATQVLEKHFASVQMCDASESNSAPKGNLLVWLRPRMFYNPQSQIFYGKITAVAYSASGKLLDTLVGEASQFGYLDVKPEQQLKQVYTQTMQQVAEKMLSSSALNQTLSAPIEHDAGKSDISPCLQGQLLPEPRVQFMSF